MGKKTEREKKAFDEVKASIAVVLYDLRRTSPELAVFLEERIVMDETTLTFMYKPKPGDPEVEVDLEQGIINLDGKKTE
jgi:hypothetical protein